MQTYTTKQIKAAIDETLHRHSTLQINLASNRAREVLALEIIQKLKPYLSPADPADVSKFWPMDEEI